MMAMFDLTIFDYIYIGVVLASTIWATIRGGVYETVATMAWVLAALAARFVSPWLDGLFQSWFKLPESTIGSLIAAYFLVFFIILVSFSFINQKIRDRVQDSVLRVTDHTLGVVFGIVRGIVIMGLVYWGALWYYSRTDLPEYILAARTRPVVQLTAMKLHSWFVPGPSALLDRDMADAVAAQEIYDNLVNPTVRSEHKTENGTLNPETGEQEDDTGYRNSERQSLENQLLQLEAKAEADARRAEEHTEERNNAANGDGE